VLLKFIRFEEVALSAYTKKIGGVDLHLAKLPEASKSLCGTASARAGYSVVSAGEFITLLEVDPENFDDTIDLEMGHLPLYELGENQRGFGLEYLAEILEIYKDENTIAYDLFHGLLSIAINVVAEARS
jgi:hypothetical protein